MEKMDFEKMKLLRICNKKNKKKLFVLCLLVNHKNMTNCTR